MHFGNVDIPVEEVIYFPEGICGFEDLKRWVLLGNTGDKDSESVFMWLQSIEDINICFVVIDPYVFMADYSPSVGYDTMSLIGTDNLEDLRFLAIVNVPDNIKGMTVNLKSPLVVNSVKNMAVQLVMDTDKYFFKHHLVADSGK